MKVQELIDVMQSIGHFNDEVAVCEIVRDKNAPMGMRYKEIGPCTGVSTGNEGDVFYIVGSKLKEVQDKYEPEPPKPTNTGFLGAYSGQETEGHPYPVMYAEKKGKPDYDLSKMKGLDGESIIVIFNNKRSNKVIFSGKVRECPNIYDLCDKGHPMLMVT